MLTGTGPVRLVIAELGIGGTAEPAAGGTAEHCAGVPAETVARALRDAGCEVVYIRWLETPEQLVRTVIQEDVDAVGVALPVGEDALPAGEDALRGTRPAIIERVSELLAEQGADDIGVFVVGTADEALGWARENLSDAP